MELYRLIAYYYGNLYPGNIFNIIWYEIRDLKSGVNELKTGEWEVR
jgi:hypothetical protein